MTPLTRQAVQRILGPVDDHMVAELLATGASEEELREAWTWANSDEALVNEQRPFPTGRAAELVEILSASPVDDEEEP